MFEIGGAWQSTQALYYWRFSDVRSALAATSDRETLGGIHRTRSSAVCP